MWVRYTSYWNVFTISRLGTALFDGGVVFVVPRISSHSARNNNVSFRNDTYPSEWPAIVFVGSELKTLHITYTINELIDSFGNFIQWQIQDFPPTLKGSVNLLFDIIFAKKSWTWGVRVPSAHLVSSLVLKSQKGSNAVKFTFHSGRLRILTGWMTFLFK